jgi:NADH-quinone oxidoreductase subunit N
MTPELLSSLSLSAPELIIALGALALLMIGVFSGERANSTVTGLAVALLVAAGAWMLVFGHDGAGYGTAFVSDAFARFMKFLTLLGAAVTLIMSVGFAKAEKFDKFEFPVLVLLATLGMLLMISANDMLALYLGLELQSLALYVIAAINRDNVRSTEAGLKYFVLGALSSGMLLYGISLVYGYTGHTSFEAIAAALTGGERQLGLVFGLVFVLAGLCFKISAVPFHMWTPDVYEGAPTPVTAFFAAAPKMAAMALIVRVTMGAFEPIGTDWQQIIVFVSIASMALGASPRSARRTSSA